MGRKQVPVKAASEITPDKGLICPGLTRNNESSLAAYRCTLSYLAAVSFQQVPSAAAFSFVMGISLV